MTPQTQAHIGELLTAAAKVNAFAKAVTGSQEMALLEAIFPGVAQVVAVVKQIEGAVDIIEAAAPAAMALEPLVASLASLADLHAPRAATGDELAALTADRERGE